MARSTLHRRNLVLLVMLLAIGCARPVAHGPYGIGTPADPRAVAAIDLAVSPNGSGLPNGSGTPQRGAALFANTCARCHGTAVKLDPDRWPFATTVFDYIRRAMPPERTGPLPESDVYAITAFTLYANGMVGPNDIMDRLTLPRVTMPNVKEFFDNR